MHKRMTKRKKKWMEENEKIIARLRKGDKEMRRGDREDNPVYTVEISERFIPVTCD